MFGLIPTLIAWLSHMTPLLDVPGIRGASVQSAPKASRQQPQRVQMPLRHIHTWTSNNTIMDTILARLSVCWILVYYFGHFVGPGRPQRHEWQALSGPGIYHIPTWEFAKVTDAKYGPKFVESVILTTPETRPPFFWKCTYGHPAVDRRSSFKQP